VIVSGSSSTCSQYAAGTGVYGSTGIVGQPTFCAVNPANADYDYGEGSESRTSNQHDYAEYQDECGIAVRHEDHFLSDLLWKPVAMTLGKARGSAQ
jgi:hypothetical protein